MFARNVGILATFGLLCGAQGHDGHHHHWHHHHTPEDDHRQLTGISRCGTPDPNFAERLKAEKSLLDHQNLFGTPALQEQTIVVPTYWHNVRTGTGTGGASEQMIGDSMIVLNEAYSGSGFTFELLGQTQSNNDTWYGATFGTEAELSMKSALRQGGRDTLNIYSTGIDQVSGILGFAYFPWDYDAFPILDGVIIGSETTPGGSTDPFNEGDTLVHEVGHWLGLYHVFQDGCFGSGDFVEDTPPQEIATTGCPVGQDSCVGDGPDSITNYMDYSDDACMFEFTQGQAERMALSWATYRDLDTTVPTFTPVTSAPTVVPATLEPTTASPTASPSIPPPTVAPAPLIESVCSFVLIWVGDVYPCLTTP